jgi:hypothetical protein
MSAVPAEVDARPRYQILYDSCEGAFGSNPDHRCVGCGTPLRGRQTKWCGTDCESDFWSNHQYSAARERALKRDRRRCRKCGCGPRPSGLEVNHLTPIMGRHNQTGCHHHVDLLETLCHDCHLKETARQFGHHQGRKKRRR